jgi:hypothetical protein
MPTLLLNGSGFADYTHWLTEIQAPGWIKSMVTLPSIQEYGRTYRKIFAYSLLVIFCSIGIAFIIYPLLIRKLLENNPIYIVLFPCLVATIYLIMSLGFALETRGIGRPEELQHRPFIWAYFVFTVWTVGGSYYYFFGQKSPSNKIKATLIGGTCSLLVVPWHFSQGVQNLEVMGGLTRIPLCQYQAAQYISQNSKPNALIQDSATNITTAALSGRQNWLSWYAHRLPVGHTQRTEQFKNILQSNNPLEISQFMRDNNIEYFIAEPGTLMQWDFHYPKKLRRFKHEVQHGLRTA